MIELAFVACLAADPSACEDRSLQFADVTAMLCLLGAQAELARWVGEHPQWVVSSFRCRELGQEASL